ncbi:MAG: valine--tRNA ligase [Candidatus Sungbacteria bacterium RIFCSPHIGHO2_02_FULL_52_23]|uniref:Valine--tRNA ligase n=1 Tax=Candidatus Sungbacteria bacterium RIFCSPHIGHO2_02_FULL_52_23 TaxID=1802274 RepID=A0A1G2KXW8_9BACT|nr:MAG: valine--tRNA ligase [Candidatus Sungbacteria bacterium RIFCSPHIGHO2_02_FULL_52_23]
MEPNEIPSQYQPQDSEDRVYQAWETSGFFNPDNLATRKKPFTIIMPPPNANGSLHIGHAVFVTLQDIMARYKRMRGFKTLWLPGADHAGFETQVVFDKKLEKEGRSRFKIPRDELYQEMLAFTLENKKIMEGQLRKLGASCDWSREKFTLDPDIVAKTQQAFVEFYNKGLVYRGERIINWCVKHQTALADLETSYVEKKDPLYYFQYGPFVIATARPETKFGDKYVVMHPGDIRYAKYKDGDTLDLEWINGPITATIIKDDAIDMSFGTGVMTITPWHDAVDFDIAERHKLPKVQVIDRIGRLLPIAGEFAGMKIADARPLIAEKLKAKGLLAKTDEAYDHKIAVCYKCNHPIEPQILPQWFLKMKPLAQKAIEAAEKGKVAFIPPRFKKIYFHWLRNIRDWNLSQQITWGIRIPAWFKRESEIKNQGSRENMEDVYVGMTPPEGKGWEQDPDVFTTWFSSGQWPFLTLGYPNSKDYKTFYPTDVMETGWDILFFWVARMVMLGIARTGKIPFKTVYLHGLVRDKDRQKMSKSKGNVIDPLGVAEQYGADALRMALIIGNLPGNDIIISDDKIRGYRNFANKIWNATRFLLMQIGTPPATKKVKYGAKEKAMLVKLKRLTADVTKDMENYRMHHAADKLYHFFWHYYADKVIEEMKPHLDAPDGTTEKETAKALLLEFHRTLITLLHPFMPFITEEIWKHLPKENAKGRTQKENLLIIEKWPTT